MKVINQKVAIGLVHWPILDRAGDTVCTNVTNFDIHDIARVARSYGVEKYYIINRNPEQLMFVSRVLDHWKVGSGSKFNPMRKTALGMVETAETLESAIKDWRSGPAGEMKDFQVVGTSAREVEGLPRVGFQSLKDRLAQPEPDASIFLVFGTGFGLHPILFEQCTGVLEPIWGAAPDQYRHLSVRSAVSIALDRLLGHF